MLVEKKIERTSDILRECDTRLTNEDVHQFLKSDLVANSKNLFKKAALGEILGVREWCDARDYLITEITLKTGTRPGALTHATLEHYKTMRNEGEYKVLLVPRHKRGVAGPAPLTFNKYLQELMTIYVNQMRPQIRCEAPCPNTLFLTKDGVAFDDRSLNRRIPEFWKRLGVRADLRVTATNIRKWIVTTCHKKKAEGTNIDELTLRQAMCHSTRAAEHFYLRESLTHTGVEAAKIIESCTSEMPESPCENETEPDPVRLSEPEPEPEPAPHFQPTSVPAGEPTFQETLSAAPSENETERSPIASQTLTPAGAETPARLSAPDSVRLSEPEPEPEPAPHVQPTSVPAGEPTFQETLLTAPSENETELSPVVLQTLTPAGPAISELETSFQPTISLSGADTQTIPSENEPEHAAVVPPALAPAVTSTSEPETSKTTAPLLHVSATVSQRPLTWKEKRAISECCKDLIQSKRKVTVQEVKTIIDSTVELRDLLKIDGMPRKIGDRVRTSQIKANTFKRPSVSQELTEEQTEVKMDKTVVDPSPNDEVPSITLSQESNKVRMEWQKEDTALLVARFSREPKYPGVCKLMSIFRETKDLKRVWSENGRARCIEKVKNFLKQKNKASVS